MREGEKGLTIPLFNDFVYSLLRGCDLSIKRTLKGKFLKAAMTEAGAKRFISSATREEKELLLSEMGITFFYTVYPKNMEVSTLREIFKKFKNKQRAEGLDQLIKEKLFVFGDEQVAYYNGLVTKNLHRPTYSINLEILKLGYNISKWRKYLKHIQTDKVREVSESDIGLMKFILSAQLVLPCSKGLVQLTEREVHVLFYFYCHKHLYLSEDDLKSNFIGVMTTNQYRYAIKGLLKAMCIQRGLGEEMEYSITTLGIKKSITMRDKILSTNIF